MPQNTIRTTYKVLFMRTHWDKQTSSGYKSEHFKWGSCSWSFGGDDFFSLRKCGSQGRSSFDLENLAHFPGFCVINNPGSQTQPQETEAVTSALCEWQNCEGCSNPGCSVTPAADYVLKTWKSIGIPILHAVSYFIVVLKKLQFWLLEA